MELANPLVQYGQIAQIQNAQNQNSLAQYQLGAAQRAEAKDVARTNMLAQAGTDDTAIANALLKSGDLKGYSDFVKTRRETQKADVELVDAKLKQSRSFLDTINPADPKAPEQYLAWHQANHADPVLGPALAARGVTAEQSMARIQQAIQAGPQAFAQLINQSKLGTEKFMELNKPTTNVGPTGVIQIPGLGGPATVVSGTDAAFQMTPAQIKQDERDRQRLGLESQRVDLERERVGLARAEADRKTQGLEALPPKEIQKREAAYPQATSVIKGFESKSDSFVKDLEKLRDHPGLSQITGLVAGRAPALTADGRAAQALYDKVVAKGGFQALQDLRDASKTGGALGNVSNQEGKQLTASFAAIDRRQDAKDVRAAIEDAIGSVQGAKTRMREAYDSTYSYKSGAEAPASNIDALLNKYK
jgi:hypothetical protein